MKASWMHKHQLHLCHLDSANRKRLNEARCLVLLLQLILHSGRVQISDATYQLLMASGASRPAEWEPTGGIEVKGKGKMNTFLWNEVPGFTQAAILASQSSPVASGANTAEQARTAAAADFLSGHNSDLLVPASVNCLSFAHASAEDGVQGAHKSSSLAQLPAVASPLKAVSKALTAVARAQTLQQAGGLVGRTSGGTGRDSGNQALRKLLQLPDMVASKNRHGQPTAQLNPGNASSPQVQI